MKKIELVNGVRTVKASGDVFIIPNTMYKIAVSLHDPNLSAKVEQQCIHEYEINNVPVKSTQEISNEYPIQVWICSHDLETTNLSDHGFNIEDESGISHPAYTSDFISILSSFLDGKKEGDVIIYRGMASYDKNNKFVLELTLKLCQLEYRYRRFGKFEEVLNLVKK